MKAILIVGTAAMIVVAGLGACGDDSSKSAAADGGEDAAPAHNCEACSHIGHSIPTRRTCDSWIGPSLDQNTREQKCNSHENGVCMAACPSADRVGTCTIAAGTDDEWTVSYFDADWTADAAEDNCNTAQKRGATEVAFTAD